MTPRGWDPLDDTDDHMPPGEPVRIFNSVIWCLVGAVLLLAVLALGLLIQAGR